MPNKKKHQNSQRTSTHRRNSSSSKKSGTKKLSHSSGNREYKSDTFSLLMSIPEYALDNSTATWWEPEDSDANPTLTISLSPAVDRDRVQTFKIDGSRLLFGGSGRGFSGSAGLPVFKYKIEVSMDGEHFSTVLDRSSNDVPRNVLFDEIPPVECRYVRLTMLDWPKNSPLSILDFSVFGKATGWSPSQVPVPTPLKMN